MRALLPLALLAACGRGPEPLPDLVEDPSFPILEVELDAMSGRALSDAVLDYARRAFHDAGVNLRFHRDEEDIEPVELSGDLQQRNELLAAHRDDPSSVHVLVALRRHDIPTRGGELVTSDRLEGSGILLFYDVLEELHPACGSPVAPSISRGEARAGTLVHELGHALQLRHDTEVGGGINFYNVMSVPGACDESQKRFHGLGNRDRSLGATEDREVSRFSQAAIDRFNFSNIVSIDTGELTGEEM